MLTVFTHPRSHSLTPHQASNPTGAYPISLGQSPHFPNMTVSLSPLSLNLNSEKTDPEGNRIIWLKDMSLKEVT